MNYMNFVGLSCHAVILWLNELTTQYISNRIYYCAAISDVNDSWSRQDSILMIDLGK